jgi:hypothetical protein
MSGFAKNWQDQEVYPNDLRGSIDRVKLIKYLRHFELGNRSLSNDLTRDDEQRRIDSARSDSYSNILFALINTDMFYENTKKRNS